MTIYVVGIGPGGTEQMTKKAFDTLQSCDTIVGYDVYINLIQQNFNDKEFITTPMTKEVQRCEIAVEEALKGKKVAMISSGDAGVYGMAGVMFEVASRYEDVEIEVVPGITAALSGGAVLGAPLTHDFAVISLSDLLTPWEMIEKKLEAAASADFSITIYNPSSKKRADYLNKACNILLKHKSPDTVSGIVKNIGRDGQAYQLMTLEKLANEQVDMFTTVFIGNSQTKIIDGRMVTPRGYKEI